MRTVSCAAPSDLIALAWYRLGYRPRDSLVLVGLSGPRHRSGLVVRADLSLRPSAESLTGALASMLPPLRRSGAAAVVGVVHRDGVLDGALREIVEEVTAAVTGSGLVLADLFGVDANRYRSMTCRNHTCCPPQGRPVSDIVHSRAAVNFVAEGVTLASDEAALVSDVLPAPSVATSSVLPLTPDQWLAAWGAVLEVPDATSRPRATTPTDWTDGRAAAFARALGDVSLRDAALCALATDDARVPAALLRWGPVPLTRRAPADDVGVALVDGLDALIATAPRPDRVERGRRVLAQAARVSRPGDRAEPLAMLAWLEWWCGHGPRARLLAQRALDDRSGHRLALLVAQLLAAGVPPTWVSEQGHGRSSMSKR